MRGRPADRPQEVFEVFLSLKVIFVIDSHFRQAHYLIALLQKCLDPDVLCECVQGVQVPLYLLAGPLLVEFFEVFPVPKERTILNDIHRSIL